MLDQQWRTTRFDELGRLVSESDEFTKENEPDSGNTTRYLYDGTAASSNSSIPLVARHRSATGKRAIPIQAST